MKWFRILMVLWLTVSVPTAALAAAMNSEHFQRNKPVTTTSIHSQHMMHAEMHGAHAQHMAHASKGDCDEHHCRCGCNCSSTHCTTASPAMMSGNGLYEFLSLSREPRLHAAGPVHAVAGHHLDILRPPSLI